ncbi:MAG TPA: hypothetical protein VFO49_03930 [Nocardioides sp.]|nr:hypothetical protein [Nocardioides sp.]
MRLMRILPAVVLALVLAGCGDDEPESGDSAPETSDPRMAQAEEILACTEEQDLPGSIGLIDGGVPAIDLTTETETIVVHVLESEAEAADYETSSGLEQEAVGNAVILGGAITPEHRQVIVDCIESS